MLHLALNHDSDKQHPCLRKVVVKNLSQKAANKKKLSLARG